MQHAIENRDKKQAIAHKKDKYEPVILHSCRINEYCCSTKF